MSGGGDRRTLLFVGEELDDGTFTYSVSGLTQAEVTAIDLALEDYTGQLDAAGMAAAGFARRLRRRLSAARCAKWEPAAVSGPDSDIAALLCAPPDGHRCDPLCPPFPHPEGPLGPVRAGEVS